MKPSFRFSPLAVSALFLAAAFATQSLAQGAHHPFAVGVNEGAASATGFSGWLLAQESGFYRLLTGAIRAARESASAGWTLAGLSFGYGVFHAAGPGHGKAVIASYMVANERVLRRGLVICLAAALLQGFVAVALVGVAFLILGTTAKHMTAAANVIEIASYVGVIILGAMLLAAKGAAVVALWRQAPARKLAPELAGVFGPALAAGGASARFFADDCSAAHMHGPDCGHFHAADPATLDAGFSWKKALLTVAAAGSRPCSGAILVLVFASAQDIFLAGCGAVLAMSLGVAITTGALATSAVFAKKAAARFVGADSWRPMMAGRLFEAAAALAVLVFGLALLMTTLSGGVMRG
ncbi:nickel/cobalt transporter [Methylocella tundrae]|uniref:Nickel/cobalt efflux system n=1 Tax=Methylocella tundrae TaxID=227605 RepID=A0A4U8Z5M6_METTU|nr:nickel/cobalt transporter [Methylocella tundrae]WPP04306.1 nickel/cobalt transporter [Methylocella tundrae]VFU10637.1 Nickel/cobalt efflux system [Methylocella tundrae]